MLALSKHASKHGSKNALFLVIVFTKCHVINSYKVFTLEKTNKRPI